MKIKELTKILKSFEKQYGNIDIYTSVDEEGNGYGTIDKDFSFSFIDEDKKIMAIYPLETQQWEDIVKPEKIPNKDFCNGCKYYQFTNQCTLLALGYKCERK